MSEQATKITLLDRLEQLTKRMEVPMHKRRNPRWLKSNLGTRNRDHNKYGEAMAAVGDLIKIGVLHG